MGKSRGNKKKNRRAAPYKKKGADDGSDNDMMEDGMDDAGAFLRKPGEFDGHETRERSQRGEARGGGGRGGAHNLACPALASMPHDLTPPPRPPHPFPGTCPIQKRASVRCRSGTDRSTSRSAGTSPRSSSKGKPCQVG